VRKQKSNADVPIEVVVENAVNDLCNNVHQDGAIVVLNIIIQLFFF